MDFAQARRAVDEHCGCYSEKIHDISRVDQRTIALHVGILTSVYALCQLVMAPVMGRLGDRIGRRPVLLAGVAGLALSEALFGVTSSLLALYLLRGLGGVAAAALLVSTSAYVADLTSDKDRATGMGWFGTVVSLGFVAGPLLGGALSLPRFAVPIGPVVVDGFSLPFLVAGALPLVTLVVATRILPKSRPAGVDAPRRVRLATARRPLLALFSLAAAGQFGLALFEGTFILYARTRISLGPGGAGSSSWSAVW